MELSLNSSENQTSDCEVKVYKCSVCDVEPYSRKRDLKKHMRTHNTLACKRETISPDPIMDVSFNSFKNQSSDSEEKVYKCSVCDVKPFITKRDLKRHMRTHNTLNSEETVYKSENNLSLSMKNRPTDAMESSLKSSDQLSFPSGKKVKCPECDAIICRRANLIEHMRVHTGEKPYKCSICSKSFAFLGNFNRHLKSHTKEKPFSCNVCKKSFVSKGDLQRHIRIHSGETPFSCPVCLKLFKHSDHLQVHMRTHAGVKPYKCSVCPKQFRQIGHLSAHEVIHLPKIHTAAVLAFKQEEEVIEMI